MSRSSFYNISLPTDGLDDKDDDASVHSTGSCDSIDDSSGATGVDEACTELSSGDDGGGKDNDNDKCQIQANEQHTRHLFRLKWALVAVISLVALGTGIAMCLKVGLSSNMQEPQFGALALEMEEIMEQRMQAWAWTMANFAVSISSLAQATDTIWPLFTMPHFEEHAVNMQEQLQSVLTGFSPLVEESQRHMWAYYSKQGYIYHKKQNTSATSAGKEDYDDDSITDNAGVMEDDDDSIVVEKVDAPPEAAPYLPLWQLYPHPSQDSANTWLNWDLRSIVEMEALFERMMQTHAVVFAANAPPELVGLVDGANNHNGTTQEEVMSLLMAPVFEYTSEDELLLGPHNRKKNIVGVTYSLIPWSQYFSHLSLFSTTGNDDGDAGGGIIAVVSDNCHADSASFTYAINGATSVVLGDEDRRDQSLDDAALQITFTARISHGEESSMACDGYRLKLYATKALAHQAISNNKSHQQPIRACAIALMVLFVGCVLVFGIFDILSQRQQQEIVMRAVRSNAVLTSMFPKQVRDRILEDAEVQAGKQKAATTGPKKGSLLGSHQKSQLKLFLNEENQKNQDAEQIDNEHSKSKSDQIADLFPATTIMFADITGFTAWSSVREPCQVFELLETLYNAFDRIAARKKVFKVETIGDCYVAVAGLPEPNKNHAILMARFSNEVRRMMNDLTKRLERTLGPDTGALCLRIGLHSGPVTAGVLRGANCRFQLFGDTVNTASRMESTGLKNKIHISSTTAELLKEAGKGVWIVPREDKVSAKGKGVLSTFWLDLKQESSRSRSSAGSVCSSQESVLPESFDCAHSGSFADIKLPPHIRRLVQWNVDVMAKYLKDIVARRIATKMYVESTKDPRVSPSTDQSDIEKLESSYLEGDGSRAYDEVKDVIRLPRFIPEAARIEAAIKAEVRLNPKVLEQLQSYVTVIASMYNRENPFHNFEHASHCLMSVTKLLSRIRAPDEILSRDINDDKEKLSQLNDFTFGITSSPLTQFTLVLAALIHDVQHEGVPNATLVAENSPLAQLYNNQSVAEQNSIEIAWNLLMDPAFKDLRAVIYTKEVNMKRFRQLVVNSIMATDIANKELKALRNDRWRAAFSQEGGGASINREDTGEEEQEKTHRKANIVIEHLMQASDVAHTMQHWHVYRKWNERFFEENVKAFKEGRATRNPVEYWYHGELGFFDFYIIPLAKKLKDCGVFGVSSDEYLSYAENNRKEWEASGKEVVAEMAANYL